MGKRENVTEEQRRARIVSIISIAVFAALAVFLTLTVGRQMITLVGDGQAFREWIAEKGIWGKVIYIGMVFIQIVISIIPGEPIELGGGYAFGAWQGLLLAETGILLASTCVFLFVKRFGSKAVYAFVPREKIEDISFLRDAEKRNVLVFIIFFIPGTPKDVITYFIGLTPMTLKEWLIISTLARIPSVLTSTLTGAAAAQQDYWQAALIFGITAVVSVIGIFVYRRIRRSSGAKAE